MSARGYFGPCGVAQPYAVWRGNGRCPVVSCTLIDEGEACVTNTIDYFEIGSPEPDASKAFYGTLFHWEIEDPTGPVPYRMVDEGRGGLWDTSDLNGERWAIFYVHVEDVAAALDQAVRLGATVAIPVTDNGGIEFAHLLDPLGNRFGIWRPKSP